VGRTRRKLIKLSRTEQLRDRAVFCKRLVDGAGDRRFAEKLQGLIDEYERGAALAASLEKTCGAPQRLGDAPTAGLEHRMADEFR
jgi:hypothetical protein